MEEYKVVNVQVREALEGVSIASPLEIVFAYEPIWAIGTGRTASPEQAQEMHAYIRSILIDVYGVHGNDIDILYGGSMKPANAKELLSQKDVGGGLIGGASLSAEDFSKIVAAAVSAV